MEDMNMGYIAAIYAGIVLLALIAYLAGVFTTELKHEKQARELAGRRREVKQRIY